MGNPVGPCIGRDRGESRASLDWRRRTFGWDKMGNSRMGGAYLPPSRSPNWSREEWERLKASSLDESALRMGLGDMRFLLHLVCLWICFSLLEAGSSSDVRAQGLGC